ncbi:hypothetical protein [Longimycelium tulufanense]|nr:hypothetical protein [Longimycelium tulufanense]
MLLVALIVGVFTIMTATPPTYRVSSVDMVMRKQGTGTGPDQNNPYANSDRANTELATMLVTLLKSPRVEQDLTRDRAVGEVEISNEISTLEPTSRLLTVTVSGTNPDDVREVAQAFRKRAGEALERRQADAKVPADQRIVLDGVVAPDSVTVTRAGQLRSAGIAGFAGLVGLVLTVLLVDRAAGRRQPTRSSDSGPQEGGPTSEPGPEERKAKAITATTRSGADRETRANGRVRQ